MGQEHGDINKNVNEMFIYFIGFTTRIFRNESQKITLISRWNDS